MTRFDLTPEQLLQAYAKGLFPMAENRHDATLYWIEATDGGDPFYFIDDRGDEYWAEIPEPNIEFSDEAGVDTLAVIFREIKLD